MYQDRCELCDEPFMNAYYAQTLCDDCFDAIAELQEEEELPCRATS